MIRCIGIDPAPSKPTVVCEEESPGRFTFHAWEPHEVRARIVALLAEAASRGERLVITWDAPLRLDRGAERDSRDYASRLIDSAVSRWKTGAPLLQDGAVGVANAASCPHNLLTQHTWGLPVGDAPAHGAHLLLPGQAPATVSAGCILAEVHPAVALAAWWVTAKGQTDAMPRYKDEPKRDRSGIKRVAEFLGAHLRAPIPFDAIMAEEDEEHPGHPDDRLDAWIACRLARDWTEGKAHPVGPPDGGSYLLPTSLSWDVLHDHLSVKAQKKLRDRGYAWSL